MHGPERSEGVSRSSRPAQPRSFIVTLYLAGAIDGHGRHHHSVPAPTAFPRHAPFPLSLPIHKMRLRRGMLAAEDVPNHPGIEKQKKTMADSTEKTVKKSLRVRPVQWDLIERAAQETRLTANQLTIELVLEALEWCKMFSSEAEIRVARFSLFTAQSYHPGSDRGRKREGCPSDPGVHIHHRAGVRE